MTHPGKGLFDKLDCSNEAYICLIVRNNQDMWIHQCREEDFRDHNTTSPKNTNKKGDHVQTPTKKKKTRQTHCLIHLNPLDHFGLGTKPVPELHI